MVAIFADNIFRCVFFDENVFLLRFHWSLLVGVELIICQHWVEAPNRRHAITAKAAVHLQPQYWRNASFYKDVATFELNTFDI